MSIVRLDDNEDGSFDVIGWDGFNGADDCYLGSIYKYEDDNYWFKSSADMMPLSCRQMRDVADLLSEKNTAVSKMEITASD